MPQPLAQGMPPSPTPIPIRDIAPPVPYFPYPAWMVVAAALVGLLAVASIVWAVIVYLKNRPKTPPPTFRELALAALQKLRARVGELEPYPFSIEVSDVLRSYVSCEFHVSATQQTSPEFLAAAARSPRFSEEEKALLAAFLERCDLIKFARYNASKPDSELLLEQALRFVEGGAKS